MPRKNRRSRENTVADRAAVVHFTVGTLPDTKTPSRGGFFNFEHEIELLKAALLYADRVKMCSVGGALMLALNNLALIRKYMADAVTKAGTAAIEVAPDA